MARSLFLSSLSFLALAAGRAAAQQTSSVTDAKTGITFQSFSQDGFSFGIAVPEDVTTDFIGQISGAVTEGWAGVSLGGNMANKVLVVAWPNGDEVVASLRMATSYTSPSVYTGSDATLMPIEAGTFVNDTAFSYTFLCKGCIQTDGTTFAAADEVPTIGWAMSSTAVTTPSSPSSALNYHPSFGLYGADLPAAKSADFATWAATASNATTPTNPTTPGAGTNTTVTVSNSTYDYIVAGGGAAGIIVAQRLAESGRSVLLLERGGASTASSGGKAAVSWNSSVTPYDVPGLGYYLTSMADTSSAYCTDTASQAGCLLGGGTEINALMYVRPQAADFDDSWPTGWKSADVAAAAERLYERNPGTIQPSADGKRYDQGAYDVLSQFLSGNGWESVDALEEPDKKHDVFTHPPWSIANGLRAGPVMSYLPLAQSLPNFKLQLNTKVVRAVRSNSTITGVEVELADSSRQIIKLASPSSGKVILAAGALSTPRILFNSGIGPASQIQTVSSGSTGVTLPPQASWIDLPVGKGVRDHPIFTMTFSVKGGVSAMGQTDFVSASASNAALFAAGSGPLVQAGQRLNFWSSAEGSDGKTRFFQGTCNAPSNGTVRMKIYMTHGLTSTGELGITADGATEFSTTPWMNTDADKAAAAAFMDRLIAMSRAANSTLTLSGGANATGASLATDFVTGAHFVGTAKMGTDDGRKNNGSAVVDLDTRVYGTDNLFVVDASIHPDLPTGNTQAIVMVAAEAAAERILAVGGASGGNSTAPSTPIKCRRGAGGATARRTPVTRMAAPRYRLGRRTALQYKA